MMATCRHTSRTAQGTSLVAILIAEVLRGGPCRSASSTRRRGASTSRPDQCQALTRVSTRYHLKSGSTTRDLLTRATTRTRSTPPVDPQRRDRVKRTALRRILQARQGPTGALNSTQALARATVRPNLATSWKVATTDGPTTAWRLSPPHAYRLESIDLKSFLVKPFMLAKSIAKV